MIFRAIIFVSFITLLFSACQDSAQNTNSANVETKIVAETLENVRIQTDDENILRLRKVGEAVKPFFKLPGKPQEYDWLATYTENGQTFDEYLVSNPTLPTKERRTIYIQPIGKFNLIHRKVIALTADYMNRFFSLPVKVLPEKLLANVPQEARRKLLYQTNEQIKTGYVLDNILKPNLPKDAAALIGFTTSDLFPDKSMMFVFGQATFSERVGIYSLFRFGNPNKSRADYEKFLTRTLKVATHETGHIFSISHCTKYECVMSGTNHLGETDRHPLDLCPECVAKICWGMKYEPPERYRKLAEFFAKQRMIKEKDFFETEAKAVEKVFAKN